MRELITPIYEALFFLGDGNAHVHPVIIPLTWALPFIGFLYAILTRDPQFIAMGVLAIPFAAILTFPFVRYRLKLREERLTAYEAALKEIAVYNDINAIYWFEPPRQWSVTCMEQVYTELRRYKLAGYKHRILYIDSSKNLLIKHWTRTEPEWDWLWYVS